MLVLHVTLAVTAGAAGAGSQHQEYAFIGSRKACTGLDVNSAYCRVLKNATDSAAMGTRLAADLYDEYHKRGAGGLINGKPRPEQLRLVKFVTTFFPVAQYQHIGEGGPGSCWVMRQLKAANYSVQGQELSRTAVGAHCAGLDVRQGFLKHLDFAESEFDVFVASDVMEHVPLPDLQPTLKSILRVTKHYFLFSVGVCAKWCHGYCSSPAIHPTGLCDTFTRQWWNHQLEKAGFWLAPDKDMATLERIMFPGRLPKPCGAAQPRQKEKLMWCQSPWNPLAHNYFMARRTGKHD
jgi:SAM-dependent methyltransferase